MSARATCCLAQLDLERRWQQARLDQGQLDEADATGVMSRLEDLELLIAATPAESNDGLLIKVERLAAAIRPPSATIA